MAFLAGIGPLGVPELIIIAFIVVLIFGVGRLPEVGGALGKGIREFRKSTREDDEPAASDEMDASASAPAPGADVFCPDCGSRNSRGAKFCTECGHSLGATVS
jgi:sec-independent protein translocase protein TatA